MDTTEEEKQTLHYKVQVLPIQRTLALTIGRSPQVMVSELLREREGSNTFTIKVVTFNGGTAQALANVVKTSFEGEDFKVSVVVTDLDGKKYERTMPPSIDDLKMALRNNPLVYNVAENLIHCQPVVVQFWHDDSSKSGFTTMAASAAFYSATADVVDTTQTAGKLHIF